jgi:transcriptional regulator with XRE-family HTH domain
VGSEFRERRVRLNMSQDELAADAGMHRDTVSAIEAGQGSPKKRRQLDETLARLEQEGHLPPLSITEGEQAPPTPAQSERPHVVRFEVQGVYGAKALIVEGPVEDLPALEAAVDRIMRRLAGEQEASD